MQYGLIFIFTLQLSWLSCTSCKHGTNGARTEEATPSQNDTVFSLTAENPSFSQRVSQEEAKRNYKFVRINVDEIVNPKSLPITFDLYWHTGEKTEFLGSVSPFPADKPGSFIVATGGKVVGEGQMELRLGLRDIEKDLESLKVRVKRLRFE